ncbi:hypothetical protein [Dyadobacter chenhuakuii]|nr:hypothetical protein [Dyadobacter chenhuakuii]MCF2496657.1 hypothetical protein [Dyadobacter chenhuakuii]
METMNGNEWLPGDTGTEIQNFWKEFKVNPTAMAGLQSLMGLQPAIKNGSHYWRPSSENGTTFTNSNSNISGVEKIFAWSKILNGQEILCAINLDQHKQAIVYVTIDKDLYAPDEKLYLLFGPQQIPAELNVEDRNGKSVRLTLPARSLIIYGKAPILR